MASGFQFSAHVPSVCGWVGGWVEKAAQENVSLEKTFHRFGSLDRDSQRAVLRCLVLFGCSTRG